MLRAGLLIAAVAIMALGGTAQAVTVSMNFDSPGDTADWYTDRYEPAVFESGVTAGGRTGVLRHGVRAEDNQANRPSSYSGDFYNYQGKKYDFNSPEGWFVSTSIDIFVDSAWNPGARAGFWTTMNNGNLTYPIIEYVVGGTSEFTGFRWWQSYQGWTEGLAVAEDAWYNLRIDRDSQNITFFIDNTQIGQVDNLGATGLANVILNVHNQGIAGEYDVLYDNLSMNAVPEPGTLALFGLGLIGAAGVVYRRRSNK